MALRPLLSRLAEHPDGAALIADGGRAFVSQSMRPYLVAALADGAAVDRPTLVVAPLKLAGGTGSPTRALALVGA